MKLTKEMLTEMVKEVIQEQKLSTSKLPKSTEEEKEKIRLFAKLWAIKLFEEARTDSENGTFGAVKRIKAVFRLIMKQFPKWWLSK